MNSYETHIYESITDNTSHTRTTMTSQATHDVTDTRDGSEEIEFIYNEAYSHQSTMAEVRATQGDSYGCHTRTTMTSQATHDVTDTRDGSEEIEFIYNEAYSHQSTIAEVRAMQRDSYGCHTRTMMTSQATHDVTDTRDGSEEIEFIYNEAYSHQSTIAEVRAMQRDSYGCHTRTTMTSQATHDVTDTRDGSEEIEFIYNEAYSHQSTIAEVRATQRDSYGSVNMEENPAYRSSQERLV